ncbi:aspartyl protease family protein [Cellvibrio fontiphilus]|uniref:Aspartyl protease family protein n=1 Tax=Cellvibrio fontiphilus TaxID=1815559 RepID=A0ABV7FCC2_9GAMM
MRTPGVLALCLAAFAAGFYANDYRHQLQAGAGAGEPLAAGAAPQALATPSLGGSPIPESATSPGSSPAAALAISSAALLTPLEQANRWIALGNYPQAAQLLEQLLAQLPAADAQHTRALRLLARVYEEQGRHVLAIASWFDYVAQEVDAQQLQDGLQYLASYLLRLAANPVFAQEQADWLMQQLNDVIRLTPDNGELHLRLANMHWEAKDKELSQYHALMAANQQDTHTRAQALLLVINGDTAGGVASGEEVTLALQRYGNQFLVPLEIDGIAARLLLDTGASISGLTSSFVERHHNLVRNTKPITLNTASGTVESYVFVVNNLRLASLDFPKHLLARLPMDSSAPFDGLLGVDILGRFEFVIDQDAAQLRLRKRH